MGLELVLGCFVLFERERMPWSQRDSSREMPEASFLDTGTFIPIPSRVLGVKLTVGQRRLVYFSE